MSLGLGCFLSVDEHVSISFFGLNMIINDMIITKMFRGGYTVRPW